MSARRILYLDAHRLSACRWEGGKVSIEGSFENAPDGLTRFAEYLRQNRHSQYYLLANSAEEGFEIEDIPYLRGGDRQALITRRLGQHFFGTPLTCATSLGFEKDKRKNEKLLFAAFTNPGLFEPWLAAIRQAEVPFTGIYSLAQLGARLLAGQKQVPSRWMLLTTQDGTVRESFIVNGITIFSRVAPLPDSSVAGTATAFAAEAAKLHQYLLGQRLVGRNETLTAYVLVHPLAAKAVRNSCINSGNLHFEVLDNHAVARASGLKTPPQDSRSETLFVHLLATRPPAQQFAGADFRRDYHLLRAKRGLLVAAAVALAAAGAYAGYQLLSGLQLQGEAEELRAREADMQRRYKDIAATFPQVQINNDALRQLIGRYGELQRQQGGPKPMYLAISNAVNQFPGVDIDRLEWKLSPGDGKSGASAQHEETAILGGELRLARKSTPRQILASFDSFVQALGQQPGLSVSVQQSPFDIESAQALKGGNSDEPLAQRPFILRIVRKAQP